MLDVHWLVHQMTTEKDPARTAYEAGREALTGQRFEEAIAHLAESARHSPHFKTLELLGEAFSALGRHSEAVVPLAAASTLNRQGRAPALLAKSLLALGDVVQAHEIALLALERAPGNRAALEVVAETKLAYENWRGLGESPKQA